MMSSWWFSCTLLLTTFFSRALIHAQSDVDDFNDRDVFKSSVLFSSSFDVIPPVSLLRGAADWKQNAFPDGSGALRVTARSSIVTLPALRISTELSFRLIFAVDEIPLTESTLFEMASDHPNDNIALVVGGHGIVPEIDPRTKNRFTPQFLHQYPSPATSSSDLTLRIFNQKKACTVDGNSCHLVLPNFIRAGVWYDLFVMIDGLGTVSVYNNATLVALRRVFRHQHHQSYYLNYVGSSVATQYLQRFLFWTWRENTFPLDQASFLLRAVQVYNSTFTHQQVQDFYSHTSVPVEEKMDVDQQHIPAKQNLNIHERDDEIMSIESSRLSFKVPTNQAVSFDMAPPPPPPPRSVSSASTPIHLEAFLLKGNAAWEQDVMGTPFRHGVIIPDATSSVQLPSFEIGGPMSLRWVFKPSPVNSIQFNDLINKKLTSMNQTTASNGTVVISLFECSTQGIKSTEVDRVSLQMISDVTVPTFTNASGTFVNTTAAKMVPTLNYRFRFQMVRGYEAVNPADVFTLDSKFSIDAFQTTASFGWYDLLVVIQPSGATSMYNHGKQIGTAQMFLPYPTARDHCAVAPNVIASPPVPLSRHPWILRGSFVGAVSTVESVPFPISKSAIDIYVEPAEDVQRVPVEADWTKLEWSYAEPWDNNTLQYLTIRHGAHWEARPQESDLLQTNDWALISSSPDQGDPTVAMNAGTSATVTSGAAVLSAGGYLNLGSLSVGGEMTMHLKFRLLTPIRSNQAILDFGNGILTPLDNIIIRTGATTAEATAADLIIQLYQNGRACHQDTGLSSNSTDGGCLLAIHGGVTAARDINLIIIFRSGLIEVYVDGILLASSTKLWLPALVARPYCFVGRDYKGNTAAMHVISLQLIPKAISSMDVQTITPRISRSYVFTFQDPYQEKKSYVDQMLPDFDGATSTVAMTRVTYPFKNASYELWNNNPFGESHEYGNIDGTSLAVTASQQRPTPGYFFNNMNNDRIQELIRDAGKLKAETANLLADINFNITIAQGNRTNATQEMNRLQGELGDEAPLINNLIAQNESRNAAIGTPQYEELFQIFNTTLSMVEAKEKKLMEYGRRRNQADDELFLLDSRKRDVETKLLQATKLQEATRERLTALATGSGATDEFGNPIPAFVNLGPMYLGGAINLRIKFRVNRNISASFPAIVLDIGNGYQRDGLVLSVFGLQSEQRVVLTVFRGALSQRLISSPMDSSRYWLDLVIQIHPDGRAQFYNWGKLVSTGSIWLPVPGVRTQCTLGAGSDGSYLSNAAVALVHVLPTIMSKTEVVATYTYDKPPVSLPTLTGPWTYTDMFNTRMGEWVAMDYESRDFMQYCGHRNDFCGPQDKRDDGSFRPDICPDKYRSYRQWDCHHGDWSGKWNKHVEAVKKEFYGPQLTLQHAQRDPYVDKAFTETLAPYLNSANLADDAPFISNKGGGVNIVGMWYYEPRILFRRVDKYFYNNDDPKNWKAYELQELQEIDLSKSEKLQELADMGSLSGRLFIVPPTIQFQYADATRSDPQPDKLFGAAHPSTDLFGDRLGGQRLRINNGDSKKYTPFYHMLQTDERIISVKTKCNYRFEFLTTKGRKLVIGSNALLDKINICLAPLKYTTNFQGYDNHHPTEVGYPLATMAPSMSKVNQLEMIEAPPGYSLEYMEHTKGGMYAWRFHWRRTPKSIEMYNLIFQFSASTSIIGMQPSQAIAVDLYNNGPIAQTVTATHSLSLVSSYTFTSEDVSEKSWNVGGSISVTESVQVGGMYSPKQVGISGTLTAYGGYSESKSSRESHALSTTQTTEDTQILAAAVPPHSKITATLLVFQGTVDIPFTADVLTTYDTGEQEHTVTNGVYTNVKTSSIIVNYSDAKPI